MVMGTILIKLWALIDGWKAVGGYVLAQLPWFMEHPLIVEAITRVIAHPDPKTAEGAEAWGNLIVQLVLLTGIINITVKNLRYGTLRLGQVRR